jgi:hypothetical protein
MKPAIVGFGEMVLAMKQFGVNMSFELYDPPEKFPSLILHPGYSQFTNWISEIP